MDNPPEKIDAIHNPDSLDVLIGKTIYSFGIPPMVRGYQYIIEAELMIVEDRSRILLLVDEVYPNVAVKCYTTVSRVERAIKHAIEISWSWSGCGSLKKQYSNDLFIPTNKQFLEFLYQRVFQSIKNDIDNTSLT